MQACVGIYIHTMCDLVSLIMSYFTHVGLEDVFREKTCEYVGKVKQSNQAIRSLEANPYGTYYSDFFSVRYQALKKAIKT